MENIRGVSGREVIRRLKKIGYRVVRQRGSHVRLYGYRPEQKNITVPVHKELKAGLLRQIIRDAGLTVNEFIELA